MPLKKDGVTKAEGVGFYSTSYGSDADDVLGYLSGDLTGVEEDEPYYISGQLFRVTVTVEQV